MKRMHKHKFIAILLAAVMLSTSIPLTIWGLSGKNVTTMDNASEEDKRIASEISNETGVSIEEIFHLKSYGRTWNEVLSTLKNRPNLRETSEKNDRDNLLLNSGLDEDCLKKLKNEGFSEKDITDVKMLGERVIFQLQEITSGNYENQVKIEEPKVSIGANDRDNDDISAYQELSKKIDINNAVYFMLKLKEDFGSYEKVFDEYLFTLQADLDLNEYISDKETYLKKKEEKKLLLDDQKIITTEKVEEKSIEKTQKESKESENEASAAQKNDNTANNEKSNIAAKDKSPMPDVPKPNIEDIKPKNPTDEIMNEIKTINPMEK